MPPTFSHIHFATVSGEAAPWLPPARRFASRIVAMSILPSSGRSLLAAGLALVLGGALGNVIDRVLWGHVIDFIRVHYDPWNFDFPAFNVADSAITVGAALLILDNLLDFGRAQRASSGGA